MNQNHPPRISAMIDKMNLINGDLSSVNMSISLDGAIGGLPETKAIKENLGKEHATKLLKALNDAFSQNDLTKVTALYSYVQLFPEQLQTEIRSETLIEFKDFINKKTIESDVVSMFTNAGFSTMMNTLRNKELMDLQFNLFERHFLFEQSATAKRIATVQKNLPISGEQKEAVIDYINNYKSQYDKAEKKDNTKTIIIISISVLLILIKIILRASR